MSGKVIGAPGPTLLAIDTSTAVLAAAIVRDGVVLDRSESFTERNHSVRAVSDLRDLLAKNGLARDDVDAIAAGQGPGSYTGVRIAVSAAKTLAWAWGKPLLGVSSLEAMAYGAWLKRAETAGDVWIVPLVDARRGQAYTALFAAGEGGSWTRLKDDAIRLLADWLEALRGRAAEAAAAGAAPQAVVFVGELGFLDGKWQPIEAAAPFVLEPSLMDAGAAGLLAARRFERGERDDVHGFVPNYTQLTEAEVNLQKARTESVT